MVGQQGTITGLDHKRGNADCTFCVCTAKCLYINVGNSFCFCLSVRPSVYLSLLLLLLLLSRWLTTAGEMVANIGRASDQEQLP